MSSPEPGTLYLVAVPIGNLGDLTRRALEVLGAVTLVASEDVQATRRLLSSQGLRARVVSYREAGREAAAHDLLRVLRDGGPVALVCEAGTPGVSDPGRDLVERCHKEGIPVSPIPGASALTAALSASGLPTRRFTFEGFLPRSGAERRQLLQSLARESRTMVFFEAPHRLAAALGDLLEVLGDRRAFLGRELTKRFEQCLPGTLSQLVQRFREEEPRGECVLVVEGAPESDTEVDHEALAGDAAFLRGLGLGARDAAEVLSRFRGIPRNVAWRAAARAGESDRAPGHEGSPRPQGEPSP